MAVLRCNALDFNNDKEKDLFSIQRYVVRVICYALRRSSWRLALPSFFSPTSTSQPHAAQHFVNVEYIMYYEVLSIK